MYNAEDKVSRPLPAWAEIPDAVRIIELERQKQRLIEALNSVAEDARKHKRFADCNWILNLLQEAVS